MPHYLPILMCAVAGFLLPLVAILLGRLVSPARPNPTKVAPYECGVAAPTAAWDHRFSVRYYLLAVLFVVFDVETIFLFPWAIVYGKLLLFGLIEMGIFLAILVLGYVYVWKRGALSWA